jgi:hypothetical protein
MTPPCPCTMPLGSPVVPEEKTIHKGWPKSTGSGVSGSRPAVASSHVIISSTSPKILGTQIAILRPGSASRRAAASVRRSNSLPPNR